MSVIELVSVFSSLTPIWQVLAIALVFTVVVAAHELGHYWFAQLNGMEVEEFAIGFFKPIWRKQMKNGAYLSFRAIPLGGFVKIKGMEPKADASETQIPDGFYGRGPWRRALVLFAGPLFSFLFAYVAFFTVFFAYGQSVPEEAPYVGEMPEDSPAKTAGIQKGDLILSVDGVRTNRFTDIRTALADNRGEPVVIEVDRQGKNLRFEVTPLLDEKAIVIGEDEKPMQNPDGSLMTAPRAILGVTHALKVVPLSIGEAATLSADRCWMILRETVRVLINPRRLKDEAGGPISIGKMTFQAAGQGFNTLILWAAILSMSLGIINLLPIPPLDGGQMLIAIAEGLRGGKRFSIKVQEKIAVAGFFFIVALILGVLFLDIGRLTGK